MKRFEPHLVLVAALCLASSGSAQAAAPRPSVIARVARAQVVVPLDWDGTWTTLDTTYTCAGAFQSTEAGVDTICGGKDYAPDSQGSGVQMNCTGSASATTFDQTCTATFPVFTDCDAHYVIEMHGTRTGDSYVMVTTTNVSYSGTGEGCSLLPPSCTQVNSWGTRTGPAPPLYCSTPARPTTWGRLKTIYR